MKTNKKKIITFNEHLDNEYGKVGTARRNKYEQGFEAFKLGVMLQEMRKKNNLTQEAISRKMRHHQNLYLAY